MYNNIQNNNSIIFHMKKYEQQLHRNKDDLSEGSGLDPEEFIGLTQVPILVVGTKVDLLERKNIVEGTRGIGSYYSFYL